MTEPVSTQQALDAIDAAAREWDDLVATVGPDRHEETGPDERWTFKDFATFGNGLAAAQVLGVKGTVLR